MLLKRSYRAWTKVILFFLIFIFISYNLIRYNHVQLVDNFRTAYNQGAESLRQSSKLDNADQLLFPRDFKDVDIKRFVAENLHIFDIDSLSHQGSKTPKLIRSKYKDQTSSQVSQAIKIMNLTTLF